MSEARELTDENKAQATAEKVQRWIGIIRAKEKKDEPWKESGRKVVRRYRAGTNEEAETSPGTYNGNKYNVLWSNVQTLRPALYGRMPNPEVVRRYGDDDPVGNAAGLILERTLSFLMDDADFDDAIRKVVQDRLLPGLGVAWERYVPTWGDEQMPRVRLQPAIPALPSPPGMPAGPSPFAASDQTSSDASAGELGQMDADPQWLHPEGKEVDPKDVKTDELGPYVEEGEPFREVLYEESVTEYVFWEDFTVSDGRSWRDIRRGGWVKRDWYLTRAEGIEEFGEIFKEVPLTREPTGLDSQKPANSSGQEMRKGHVWEVWDAATRKAFWLSPDWPQDFLRIKSDPLELEDFFPCAPPLMATTTSDRFYPVADYIEYRDQAMTLDALTSRIDLILDAVKVAGVYDGSEKAALAQLFRPGAAENVLIPVEGWGDLAAKGGLGRIIEYIPLQEIINTLTELFNARDRIKADLYEITGMSDILRGQNDPDSTATAERIKGKFASLRLGDQQAAVQRYIRDVIRIKAEVICTQFSPETILEMSGYDQADGATQDMAMQAIALLKSTDRRRFRIDIETDSTIAADEQEEQAQTVLLIESISKFLAQAAPIVEKTPELLPMMSELLQFSVRRFKAGRTLEEVIKKGMATLQQKAGQASEKPDPEMAKVQATQQIETAKLQGQMQLETMRAQTATQQKQAEMDVQRTNDERDFAARQAEIAAKAQSDHALALIEQDTRLKIAHIDAASRIEVARIAQQTKFGEAAYEMEAKAAGEDPEAAEAEEAAEEASGMEPDETATAPAPEPVPAQPHPAVQVNIHPPGASA